MFTMTSKFNLNKELETRTLRVRTQGYDVVCSGQIKRYWDLCGKRREE